VGRRESWWANFLLNAAGIIISVALILVLLFGLGTLHAPA